MAPGRPKLGKHLKKTDLHIRIRPVLKREIRKIWHYGPWIESVLSMALGRCPLCHRESADIAQEERLKSYRERKQNEIDEASCGGDEEEREDGGNWMDGT
jgi:hypothetical protein